MWSCVGMMIDTSGLAVNDRRTSQSSTGSCRPRPAIDCRARYSRMAPGRFLRLVLARAVRKRGVMDAPPVVEHVRYMMDVGRPLGGPQGEIGISSRFVKTSPQSADSFHQVAANHRQVADVVVAQERVGRPVRLEVRVLPMALFRDVVLVGVDEVQVRLGIQCLDHLEQGERRERVVVIEKGDIVAPASSRAAMELPAMPRFSGNSAKRIRESRWAYCFKTVATTPAGRPRSATQSSQFS